MSKKTKTSLEHGAALIRRLAKTLPDTPGVYRMLDKKGEALYVGKAKSLRRRVVSYANTDKLPLRLQRMVANTVEMAFIHTHTEVEALLLEANLIKKLKPPCNVLLRDDKSFPYILLTADHEYPLLAKHRGAQGRKGDYFGPFASGAAVNKTLASLQRAFMLRNCSDSYFAARKRPCLQYHIKRCTAPCVGYVSTDDYALQVKEARDFLSGKSSAVQARLAKAMQKASDDEDFEAAARLRDRIAALTYLQSHQDINVREVKDADVIGLSRGQEGRKGKSCVQVFFFRGGQNFGNRAYYPRHAPEDTEDEILTAFVAQFYENKPPPPEIVISHPVKEKTLLEAALTEKSAGGRKVRITHPQKGARKRLADFVVRNAREALENETLRQAGEDVLLEKIAALFGLEETPWRIEVYDNSHISGTNMVGAMIIAGPEGFRKSSYRKFNIKKAAAADDYGMMDEVLTRRFGRALAEGKGPGTPDWPDIVLIDGGKGQFTAARKVLEELGAAEDVTLVAIAKGPDRNAGREKFFTAGRAAFQLPIDDPALHYLQRLRDEAHRFAIGAHRARRSQQITASPLDDIPGIGAKRKKALLHHFGSGAEVARAGLKDLEQVEGISAAMALKVYEHFKGH